MLPAPDPTLALWLGPAVVAAVIAALIQVVSWRTAERRDIRTDDRRRAEKVRDIQAAIQAEIRSIVGSLDRGGDGAAREAELADRVRATSRDEGSYTPFVPKLARPAIFDNVVKEIHVLPVTVIDDVVLFYRQFAVLIDFAEDLRSERYRNLDPEAKAAMLEDYFALRAGGADLGRIATAALAESLALGRLQ